MTVDEYLRGIERDMNEWIRTIHHLRANKGSKVVNSGLAKARSLIITRKLQSIRNFSLQCNFNNKLEDYRGHDLTV